jgi:hypothetical protein
VVLGTHVRLDSFAVLSTFFVDVLTSLVRTDEGNGLDGGVIEDIVNSVVATVNEVDNTSRKVNLLNEAGQNVGGTSNLLRWLHHVSVTAGNADREHPERNHNGEVEGSDTSADTNRNSVAVGVNTL